MQHVKMVKFIFDIIGQPIASFIGIILNSLIILVLLKKKKSIINPTNSLTVQNLTMKSIETIFNYILLNSIINLIGCLLYGFKLISECIDFTGIYCSQMYFSKFGQKFFIYGINFIGQSLKTASLLSNLSISLYSIIATMATIRHKQLLSNISMLILIPIIFILSFGLNVIKIFLNDRN